MSGDEVELAERTGRDHGRPPPLVAGGDPVAEVDGP